MRRLIVPRGSIADGVHVLDEDSASYVRDVLRSKRDDRLLLSDGDGVEATAAIEVIERRQVTLRIEDKKTISRTAHFHLSLLQCVGKGDKMDAVVRQATELGVSRISPLISARSVGEKRSRTDRWRTIAEDAVRVSGRAYRPQIDEVGELEAIWGAPRAGLALVLALNTPHSLGALLSTVEKPPATVEIIIGPEGGLTDEETEKARDSGFSLVHLGPHTLRTETAGPAVVAMLMYWAGAIAR